MNYNLIVDELALLELGESIKYYKNVSLKVSNQFKKSVKEELELINKEPLLFQERYRNVRISFIKKFPYGIHFILRDTEIRIIRILHTKQFYVS